MCFIVWGKTKRPTALKTARVPCTVVGCFPSGRAVEGEAVKALPVQTQMLLVSVFVGKKITFLWGEKIFSGLQS